MVSIHNSISIYFLQKCNAELKIHFLRKVLSRNVIWMGISAEQEVWRCPEHSDVQFFNLASNTVCEASMTLQVLKHLFRSRRLQRGFL